MASLTVADAHVHEAVGFDTPATPLLHCAVDELLGVRLRYVVNELTSLEPGVALGLGLRDTLPTDFPVLLAQDAEKLQ